MARLYANENFPRAVVECLRDLGHDVLTTFEAGKANQGIPDPDVLEFACSQGRAVLTLNRKDFKRLHQSNSAHCGIIICTEDKDWGAQAWHIDAAIGAVGTLENQLLRVHRSNPPPLRGP